MNATLAIARKELRTLFQAPVAMIFLGVFLAVTLFTFFSASTFFARNIADMRPLFDWLPVLLIGLVSAVTMRSWAEERRAGTLEVLLTLPVHTRDLVLGKFVAGMALIALALVLTLPLPMLVSTLGELDWGPVIGGYCGAMLLGSAYMAIGLCVSARTDNQVVALMVTLIVGGLVYLVGSDSITALLSNDQAELARALGSGSRFESIGRGVLDLRDLLYYGTLTAIFLVLNGVFLELDRLDPNSAGGKLRRNGLRALIGLAVLNALLANVWMAPITQARLDLTAHGDYSISPMTRQLVAQLDEPLVIEGFISERTHPLLAPLVPQIRDLVTEYAVHGGRNVTVRFRDPASDEELEQQIGEQYGIRSFPFGVTDRHSQAVINSYFHLLVQYGDEFEVLSFQDLIEVQPEPDGGLDVRLRNLEYDLTGTIKRVSQDFESLESLLAKLPQQATFTAYVTPDVVPDDFQPTLQAMRAVGAKMQQKSSGNVLFKEVDPSEDRALQQRLYDELGVRPLAADLFGTQVFYLHLVLDFGDSVERILPRGQLTEVDLEQAIEAATKRATPGQLKTVGFFTEQPIAPPPNPQIPPQFQPPPPVADYRNLQQMLTDSYDVQPLQLDDGHVPDTVDVLIVGKTGPMSAEQRYAIDQYLMRGGAVVALAGNWRVQAGQQGLSAAPEDDGLAALLNTWGAIVDQGMVMDPQNAPFPIPVNERRGGFTVQRIELLPYPMFADVRPDGFNRAHAALAGLGNITLPWASPVRAAEPLPPGVAAEVVLTSSEGSWLNTTGNIDPDFAAYPEVGFGPNADTSAQPLALSLTGRFPSNFAGKPTPGFNRLNDGPGRALESSVADGRVLVLGSSELVGDLVLSLTGQPGGEVHLSNLQFIQNAIDWAVEDTELLAIRSGGASARTLVPMTDGERSIAEWTAYGAVGFPLLLVVGWPRWRRRRQQPIPVEVSS
jgi:ABC-2 type transport system permease protein